MAFCQMLCVLREAEVLWRLFAGIRTRPAVAGMVATESAFSSEFWCRVEEGASSAVT